MGLGGGRKRVKIGHDPNNETWARQTANFGHRMLVSQGWAPGQVLGASADGYYSAHHLTSGSHSHIKVALREDNLGLGAKRGSGQDAGECVGLDAFQGLLGRLNGKSEDALEKEQRSRDDLKRSRYMELRGTVKFVRGGTLVSDMDELIELARRSRIDMGLEEDDSGSPGTKPSKKVLKKDRAANKAKKSENEPKPQEPTPTTEKKKSKKRKNRETEADQATSSVDGSKTAVERMQVIEFEVDAATSDDEGDDKARKARRKAEKAEKRERKQRRRDEKAAKKIREAAGNTEVGDIVKETQAGAITKETLVVEPAAVVTAAAKEQATAQQDAFGRHASVRSRYIAAKRRAVMDPQALKEILMVKA